MMLQNITITETEYSAEVDGKQYTVKLKKGDVAKAIEEIRALAFPPKAEAKFDTAPKSNE
jgi:hypothetical protein